MQLSIIMAANNAGNRLLQGVSSKLFNSNKIIWLRNFSLI